MRKINLHKNISFYKVTALLLVISLVCSLCSCMTNSNDFDGKRFSQTKHISVRVETLKKSGITVNNSACAKNIHDAVLRDCNIDVQFVDSKTILPNYGIIPDISVTSDYNMITTYYRMNSVVNLAPYIYDNKDSLTNLISLLGSDNIYYCTDNTSEIWYLRQCDLTPDSRVTFIRSDWLDKLNLDVPTTREELHKCLIAFRDNADLLLGENASNMIPFFIDNEPAVSAKPLFDSCYDPDISAEEFYLNGYNRSTQNGYQEGLQILNDWYLEGLLPTDFMDINPMTKESYEPIESGFVGVFCSKYDYLYINGDNSHIDALKSNCGSEADYIAVNTFENKNGDYTAWQEDYLAEDGKMIYMPTTCSDPLACLVYLNWLSDPANIEAIQNLSINSTDSNDQYTYDRYLITVNGLYPDTDLSDNSAAIQAENTALQVKYIHRGGKCNRYGPKMFEYSSSELNYSLTYPESQKIFNCSVITAPIGMFDTVYNDQFSIYMNSGAYYIYGVRESQWNQVVLAGSLTVW